MEGGGREEDEEEDVDGVRAVSTLRITSRVKSNGRRCELY